MLDDPQFPNFERAVAAYDAARQKFQATYAEPAEAVEADEVRAASARLQRVIDDPLRPELGGRARELKRRLAQTADNATLTVAVANLTLGAAAVQGRGENELLRELAEANLAKPTARADQLPASHAYIETTLAGVLQSSAALITVITATRLQRRALVVYIRDAGEVAVDEAAERRRAQMNVDAQAITEAASTGIELVLGLIPGLAVATTLAGTATRLADALRESDRQLRERLVLLHRVAEMQYQYNVADVILDSKAFFNDIEDQIEAATTATQEFIRRTLDI